MSEENFTNTQPDFDLSQFDDAYAQAPEERDTEVPDGAYQVNVEAVEMVASKKGTPMLKWTLRVLGPTHQDRQMWRYNGLANDDNVRFLKPDLVLCGLQLERFSDLRGRLTELLDVKLEVKKVTKGEFANIYFRRRILAATPPTDAGAEVIPF